MNDGVRSWLISPAARRRCRRWSAAMYGPHPPGCERCMRSTAGSYVNVSSVSRFIDGLSMSMKARG